MAEQLQLGWCGQPVFVFPWKPRSDYRHAADHMLKKGEGWQMLIQDDLDEIRDTLDKLCLQRKHGPGCPGYPECEALLEPLVHQYRRFVDEAIREGAKVPRHTHNEGVELGVRPSGEILAKTHQPSAVDTMYFLDERGICVELYRNTDELRPRTAWRRGEDGPLKSNQEYFRAAKQFIKTVRRSKVVLFCDPKSWGELPPPRRSQRPSPDPRPPKPRASWAPSVAVFLPKSSPRGGRQTAIAAAFEAAKRRRESGKPGFGKADS